MLKKDNRSKLLKVFFDDPIAEGVGFQLRELSRLVNIAPKSVKLYLGEFEKEELILREKDRVHGYPMYFANRDHEYFRLLKKIDTILSITESGLLKYLYELCMPEVIILFGSSSRGEDILGSDIDIYLQCKEKKLNLGKYERVLKRKISVFFEEQFDKLSEELKRNIINGDKLKGYLRVGVEHG